jgi:hypothetical protein
MTTIPHCLVDLPARQKSPAVYSTLGSVMSSTRLTKAGPFIPFDCDSSLDSGDQMYPGACPLSRPPCLVAVVVVAVMVAVARGLPPPTPPTQQHHPLDREVNDESDYASPLLEEMWIDLFLGIPTVPKMNLEVERPRHHHASFVSYSSTHVGTKAREEPRR